MTKRKNMTVNDNGKKNKTFEKKIKMQARLGIHENFCSYFYRVIVS